MQIRTVTRQLRSTLWCKFGLAWPVADSMLHASDVGVRTPSALPAGGPNVADTALSVADLQLNNIPSREHSSPGSSLVVNTDNPTMETPGTSTNTSPLPFRPLSILGLGFRTHKFLVRFVSHGGRSSFGARLASGASYQAALLPSPKTSLSFDGM